LSKWKKTEDGLYVFDSVVEHAEKDTQTRRAVQKSFSMEKTLVDVASDLHSEVMMSDQQQPWEHVNTSDQSKYYEKQLSSTFIRNNLYNYGTVST
jgi:hypothetical protein